MKVIVSPLAKADLREIILWIAADSARTALTFAESLTSKIESLDRMGHRHPLIGRCDLRRLTYCGYHIFYRIRDQVEVVRIIHGARDWPSLLDDGD